MSIRQKALMLVTTVTIISLVFAGLAKAAPNPEVVKVGVLAGLTGPGSQMNMAQRDFILMCRDWINKKGGVTVKGKQYQIQCMVEDTKNTTAGSVTAATKLIAQDQVKYMLGGSIPVMIDAVSSVTEQNKVLYIASMSDVIHPDRPFSFVGNYSYASPLAGLYDSMLRLYPGVKAVGYMVEDEPGARAIAEVSKKMAKDHGLQVLEPIIHPWSQPSITPSGLNFCPGNRTLWITA